MTPLVDAFPLQSPSPAGPMDAFPPFGFFHRSALVDGGPLSCKAVVEARPDVATVRLEGASGGAAGTLIAGGALIAAAALLLALVVPWFPPLERRTP